MKKLISLLLIFVMLLGMMPTVVFSAGEAQAEDDSYTYPINSIEKLPGTIRTSDNTYVVVNGYYGAVIDLKDLDYNTVVITERPNGPGVGYAFLVDMPTVGRVPNYAGDYTAVIWSGAKGLELEIPGDAAYLYIYYNSKDVVFLPQSVVFKNVERESSDVVGGTSIRVATWNIGHFSGGKNPNTKIADSQYQKAAAAFTKYIEDLDADLLTLNEYSYNFTPSNAAKPALFGGFTGSEFEGPQSRYSCNALYSNLTVKNLDDHAFVCNQSAKIEHTNLIAASDYYYVSGEITLGGETVTVVTAHLAFDLTKNPDTVNLNQIYELIDTFADHERVILMGDWNARFFSYFSIFEDAGYTLGNTDSSKYTCGSSSLDNIMVKGLKVSDFTVHTTGLSDHYAVSATVSLVQEPGEPGGPGDFDSDGYVTESDVIWLLWHTVSPEEFPLNGNGDFDGDGYITEADVIWLLWHTVSPEEFPLTP